MLFRFLLACLRNYIDFYPLEYDKLLAVHTTKQHSGIMSNHTVLKVLVEILSLGYFLCKYKLPQSPPPLVFSGFSNFLQPLKHMHALGIGQTSLSLSVYKCNCMMCCEELGSHPGCIFDLHPVCSGNNPPSTTTLTIIKQSLEY